MTDNKKPEIPLRQIHIPSTPLPDVVPLYGPIAWALWSRAVLEIENRNYRHKGYTS